MKLKATERPTPHISFKHFLLSTGKIAFLRVHFRSRQRRILTPAHRVAQTVGEEMSSWMTDDLLYCPFLIKTVKSSFDGLCWDRPSDKCWCRVRHNASDQSKSKWNRKYLGTPGIARQIQTPSVSCTCRTPPLSEVIVWKDLEIELIFFRSFDLLPALRLEQLWHSGQPNGRLGPTRAT